MQLTKEFSSVIILVTCTVLLFPSVANSEPDVPLEGRGPGDGGECYFIYTNGPKPETFLFANPNTPFALSQNCSFEFQHRRPHTNTLENPALNRTWGGAFVWFNGVNASSSATSSVVGSRWWNDRDREGGSTASRAEEACKEYVVTFELVVRRHRDAPSPTEATENGPSKAPKEDEEIESKPIPFFYCADGVRRFRRDVPQPGSSIPMLNLRDAFIADVAGTKFLYRMPDLVKGDAVVKVDLNASNTTQSASESILALPTVVVMFRIENSMPILAQGPTDHLIPALRLRVISNVSSSSWSTPPQSMAHAGLLGGAFLVDGMHRSDLNGRKLNRFCPIHVGTERAVACPQNYTFRPIYQHYSHQYECSCVPNECSSRDKRLGLSFQCKDNSSCIPIECVIESIITSVVVSLFRRLI